MTEERKAFEAWAKSQVPSLRTTQFEDGYSSSRTDDCWRSWQARSAIGQQSGCQPARFIKLSSRQGVQTQITADTSWDVSVKDGVYIFTPAEPNKQEGEI